MNNSDSFLSETLFRTFLHPGLIQVQISQELQEGGEEQLSREKSIVWRVADAAARFSRSIPLRLKALLSFADFKPPDVDGCIDGSVRFSVGYKHSVALFPRHRKTPLDE